MALDPTKNFAYGLVEAGGHSAAATSFNTVTGYGTKFPATADGAFNIVWWNITDYTNPAEDPNAEIVRVTARAGEAFTVTRAQESTSASTKNTVGKVYAIALCMTKKMIDDISTVLAASDAAVAAAVALVAGISNASSTAAGLVELATSAEALAGTLTGGTGAKLVVTPDILQSILQGQASTFFTEDGTGSDDTYTAVCTPTLTAYVTGQAFRGKFTIANTTACTLNLNSLGAKSIKKYVSGSSTKAELETGDIVANQTCFIVYDGTDFVLLNPSATMPTTALLAEMATFFGATDITGAEAEDLTDGGSSVLHYHPRFATATTYNLATATGTTVHAHGLAVAPKWVKVTAFLNSTGGSAGQMLHSVGTWINSTYACAWIGGYVSGSFTMTTGTSASYIAHLNLGADQSSDYAEATVTVDATNVTLNWTKNLDPVGTAVLIIEAGF